MDSIGRSSCRVYCGRWRVVGWHPMRFAILFASLAFAADPDGSALYKLHCAMCHDASGETRAPAPSALKQMSPENIVRALESGLMKDQGASLTSTERRTVAEFLTGKAIGTAA